MKYFLYSCLLFIVTIHAFAADKITPGVKWSDTSGTQINAHGGCVTFYEGAYYWFGEDRNGSVSNGVSCYKSTDLYNWKKVGLALTPTGTATDAYIDIAKGRTLERPKVIYNEKTKKWVMWVHWENGNDYGAAKVCVATSNNIEGPYVLSGVFRPNDHDSRDQTLFKDDDGKAYHFCSTNMNTDTNAALLADDYLTPTSTENLVLQDLRYEASSIYKVGEAYFGLFSGCTGWTPNRGRYAYSYNILGNWTYGSSFKDTDGSQGTNFAVDEGKETTYQSQSAYVFKLNGLKNAFVYMGDRWNSSNVGASYVVWLPLSMRSGYPTVRWYDSWDISVFNEMYRYKRAKEIVSGNVYSLLEKSSNRFISRPSTSFTLENDDETVNLNFTFVATDQPYVYKIKENVTGKFLESVFGSLRLNAEADKVAQTWYFKLQEDGYYKIKNMNDDRCLSVSGASTYAGTNIFLNVSDPDIPQNFGVYFDSKNHPDYVEADLFSAAYRVENQKLIAEQDAASPIETIYLDAASKISVFPTVSEGSISIETKDLTGTAEVRVVEAGSGRIIQSKKMDLSSSLSLDLSEVSNGMYLIYISSDDISVVKKVMILK